MCLYCTGAHTTSSQVLLVRNIGFEIKQNPLDSNQSK